MQLERALPGVLVAARDQVTLPTTVSGIADLFGGGKRGASGLATALVQETGTFKTYASALRNVERYLKGERGEGGQTRRPSKKTAAALEQLANSRVDVATARAIQKQGVTVDFSGTVIVSPGGKADERDRDINNVYISPEDAAPFLDALLHGKLDEAADEFNVALLDAYGVGNAYITDVSELGFTIGEQ